MVAAGDGAAPAPLARVLSQRGRSGDDVRVTVRLALVPPGLTAGAREGLVGADEPLDEHGRAAALAVAERRVLPTGVPSWVAPSTQCRETAGLLGLQPVDDEGLRDWDLGRWVGRSMTDVAQQEGADVAAWRADPSSAVHGGESLLQRSTARARGWPGCPP
ncbi:hypothetical protein GCM10025868_10910 [Angustibacter aerolatus]|uniref:Uncharacterized protein n=1 Tax=Angustibacter aerolatus TaxID=1162965 RepID=A0ABQ6JCC6_9ACTN|nr:hypothetical protein GCM10025868_10910 [Angustibacter aerolatus]